MMIWLAVIIIIIAVLACLEPLFRILRYKNLKRKIDRLRYGMPKTEVAALLGKPVRTELTTTGSSSLEKWIYEFRPARGCELVTLTFEKGTVTDIDTTKSTFYKP